MSYGSDNKGLVENLWETESMNYSDFKTNHFILFGLNINNDKNNNKLILKYKTDILNFIYNFFNTAILMFKIDNEGTQFEQKINENNKIINNILDKYLKISPDIRSSYQVIHNNLIIGEYFRYNNYFFNINQNKSIDISDEIDFGKITLNFTE